MIETAAPPGLRPDRSETAARALMFERAAVAFGMSFHGLSPAQAALAIVQVARALVSLGSAEAERLNVAASQVAAQRELEAFSAAIARDIQRIERLAALRRQGYSVREPTGLEGLAIPAC